MVKNAVWFFGSKMVEVGLSAPCQYLPHEVLTPIAQIKPGLSIPAIPSIPTSKKHILHIVMCIYAQEKSFGLLGTAGIDRSIQGRKKPGCRCQYLLCWGVDKVLTGRFQSKKQLCSDQPRRLGA